MKVLFDQGVPAPLRHLLTGCDVLTAHELGWGAYTNGPLLDQAEAAGFGALVTTDQNLPYQQSLAERRLAVVVVSTTSWPRIRARADEVAAALARSRPGTFEVVHIG